jgi:glycosyltransferase involved in cell wall biosynthesis
MDNVFISICIPSYNRPKELLRLLRTIDCDPQGVQIVICEDHAPKRLEVRENVEIYRKESVYPIKYIENEVNKGYDWNIRDFILQADGEYIIYIGDDDGFVPHALDRFIAFLKNHRELGYVLRCTRNQCTGEHMRYFPETCFFEPGSDSYQLLYRKSVIISGFTFKRELAREFMTDRFDGTLLYQLYIMAEICLKHPSAYFNEPITESLPGQTDFYFGSSEKEKGLYEPGKVSVRGSTIFVASFLKITRCMDEKYGLSSTKYVQRDMSKYSYPILAYLMKRNRLEMLKFAKELYKIGLGNTPYFYVYTLGLLVFGTAFCGRVILLIKKCLGHTPQL